MKFALVLSFSLLTSLSVAAPAQDVNTNPLVIHAFINHSNVHANTKIPVRIQLELDSHYHAYKQQFELKVQEPFGATVSEFKLKPIVKFYDKVSHSEKEGIHEHGDMFFDLTLPANLPANTHRAVFELRFQACAADHCLFPKKIKAAVDFNLVETSLTNPDQLSAKPGTADNSNSWSVENALNQGSWHAFILIFFFGILTSFTPCIFPMIPITLSVIGAREIGQAREGTSTAFSFRGLSLGIFYALGIAITYALLGLFAAKTGALFGSMLGSPLVVISISAIFVLMGLSMYGLFDLQVPAFIRDSIGAKHTKTGYGGAFASGLIAGVVAGPCIGPILVTVLAFVAHSQNLFLGFSLLFTYAMGLGLIFIMLGAFSGLLSKLPRSGSWMEVSKFIFGTSMVALAIYYVAPVVSHQVLNALIAVALILISSFYGAFQSLRNLSLAQKFKKSVMIVTFVFGFIFAANALTPDVPIAKTAATAQVSAGLNWKKYSAGEFDKARSQHKPLILDFSADWCGACKELERYTYSDARVQTESLKFHLFSFDATSESADLTELRKQYSILGLPTLLFFGADGQLKEAVTLTGFESADQFLERMKKAEL